MNACNWCRERLGTPIAKSLGQHCSTCIDSGGAVLDVDYVSTTFLSSNVHGMRHNYFHLNRSAPAPCVMCCDVLCCAV